MAPTPTAHSHRSTTKTVNKPFKTKHASKSSLKNAQKGKVEAWEKGSRKTPHQQVMNKIDRRNQAKQRRLGKNAEREEEGKVFLGRNAAPRIVAVVPLTEDVDVKEVVRGMNASVEVESGDILPREGLWIPRFKQKLTYLTPSRELVECLDACRVADFVLFVLSAEEEVDEVGEHLLRCIESQGVSTVLTGVYALDKVEPAKKRPDVLKSLKSFITHFFAAQEKVHDLSNRQDCSNVMRSLCTTMPKGVRWREDRSWMMVEDCKWEGEQAVVTGVVRGQGLKADRLLQVGEWGDFQIDKIVAAPLETRPTRTKTDDMAVDAPEGEKVLESPTEDQDDLAELAPEEAVMDDMPTTTIAGGDRKAVLLDDHHYFNDDRQDQYTIPKRLPRGTSKYQAAWYLGDVSDSGSDLENVEDDDDDMSLNGDASMTAGPEDGHFNAAPEPTEAGAPSEYPQSEMFLDPAIEDEADQLEEYRKNRRNEAAEDLEFPDEIELSPHVDARERLARYRGLKSLRTSHWDIEEDKPHEPSDWSRLLEISDYRSAKNKVLKEARMGGVPAGTRVSIHITIPADRVAELQSRPKPTAVFGLLRHEHKQTSLNISMTLSSEHHVPLRSKEELILQCGPRRLVINPLFSAAGNTPNNVHKFSRYLHPGQTAVATFIGPVIWGAVPCLVFKNPSSSSTTTSGQDAIEDLAHSLSINANKKPALEMIATGTTLLPSSSRIIAKRIILTGHPYKIHKKLVTIRYMFFNDSDVRYFSALQLWTKRGRSGYIKEPLGTHGYFKATFDGRVNPLDSVGVSLYKRVWPRSSRAWRAGDAEDGEEEEVPKLMEVEA